MVFLCVKKIRAQKKCIFVYETRRGNSKNLNEKKIWITIGQFF